MLKLCDIEPVLTSMTRLTLARWRTSTPKVWPMSMKPGAAVIEGRGARTPPAAKR